MIRRAALPAILAAALSLPAPARAGGPEDDKAQARSYFDAGLQAYAAAQYIAAADSFLKAYKVLPSQSLIFSAAQAYRRQFLIDKSPDHLREALRLYRDYLKQAEQGRRREEAADAISELSAFELRLGDGAGKPQERRPTQLLVTSRTPGAQTSIDGGPPRKVPLVARVLPGEHVVVVRAAGHFEDRSTAIAVARETISVNVLLRPVAVDLRVRGDAGAKVFADGRLLAQLPHAEPLRLTGGEHTLTVLRPGHVPYSTSLSVASGSRVDLDVILPPTAQRYAAVATLGLSGAGVVIAGLLGGLAGQAYSDAKTIDGQRVAGEITSDQRDAYNHALDRRDRLAAGAASAGGAAAALAMLGVGLYLFDNPDVAASSSPSPSGRGAPNQAPDPELFIDARGLSLRASF